MPAGNVNLPSEWVPWCAAHPVDPSTYSLCVSIRIIHIVDSLNHSGLNNVRNSHENWDCRKKILKIIFQIQNRWTSLLVIQSKTQNCILPSQVERKTMYIFSRKLHNWIIFRTTFFLHRVKKTSISIWSTKYINVRSTLQPPHCEEEAVN